MAHGVGLTLLIKKESQMTGDFAQLKSDGRRRQPPMEALGTSGIKEAVKGVPGLNVLDGWWIEGHLKV